MGDLALKGCLHLVEALRERLLGSESFTSGGGEPSFHARQQHQRPRTPKGGEDGSSDEAAHGFHGKK
jgi:hypothetical protein